MRKYVALIYNPADLEGHHSPEILQEYGVFIQAAREADVLVMGEPLEDPETATTVRVSGGRAGGTVTLTDGPFAETKEILAGFMLLDCEDRDEVLY
jgi:hypothetical protein